ncbi:MAG: hypothetical protein HOP32_14190 [Nitrospira sp.]|nr:hypothetical protein [Nitrospira sp.]
MVNSEKDPDTFLERLLAQKELLSGLAVAAGIFLLWSLYVLGHDDSSEHLVPHVFSVLLELLLGVIVIELLWRGHEKREERKQRETQLRFIKSYMFQARMRDLFKKNFGALNERSEVTLEGCFSKPYLKSDQASYKKLLGYQSEELKAGVIIEYVKAEGVWHEFLTLAIMFSIGRIVKDMTEILQLIDEVKSVIQPDSCNSIAPDVLAAKLQQDKCQKLKEKLEQIMKDGILKFWDYADELNRFEKEKFNALKKSYGVNCGDAIVKAEIIGDKE